MYTVVDTLMPRPWWQRVLISGSLASLFSATALALEGRRHAGSAAGPINAPAHWFWGRQSLRRNDVSAKHTAVGFATHHVSSLFWASFFEALLSRKRWPGVAEAAGGAAAVTAVAAVVDLKLVPERLTPGFERRLPGRSLGWVYGSFAVGLAVGALIGRR